MKEQTRVAFVLPSLERGAYWHPVFQRLTCMFPNMHVFTQIWPGFVEGFENSFRVRNYGGRQHEKQPFIWGSPRLIVDLIRFRPRVIFTSGFHIWAVYVLLLKFIFGWRIVLLWDGIGPSVAKVQSRWWTALRCYMARGYDQCLVNTTEALEYLRDVLHVPASRLARNPYEVPDTAVMDRDHCKLPALRRPIFLFAGSFIERKGVPDLLWAAHALVQQGVEHFSLLVIGGGRCFGEFKRLAIDLGLTDCVHWQGAIPYHQMGAYYRTADVFVFPTREDIWGMVALEAMAFGKPIICSCYAGARELVKEGINGYIIEPGDPWEVAERMARFIRNPDTIELFGAASKEIMAPLNAAKAATMLAGTIHSMLDREPDARATPPVSQTI